MIAIVIFTTWSNAQLFSRDFLFHVFDRRRFSLFSWLVYNIRKFDKVRGFYCFRVVVVCVAWMQSNNCALEKFLSEILIGLKGKNNSNIGKCGIFCEKGNLRVRRNWSTLLNCCTTLPNWISLDLRAISTQGTCPVLQSTWSTPKYRNSITGVAFSITRHWKCTISGGDKLD